MTVEVVNKVELRQRLDRALRARKPGSDFLLQTAVDDLGERLEAVERHFPRAVAYAATDSLAVMLRESGKVDAVLSLAPVAASLSSRYEGVVGDEERLPFGPESIELFATALTFQWTNDLPGALAQIRRALRPDGLLIASLLGGDTLMELRESLVAAETEVLGGASPRVLPFADVRAIGALMQRAGFALPVVDRDVLTVRYDTAFGLLRDLRNMGATNVLRARDRRPATRQMFLRMAEIYAERFSDPDGRVRATFEIISISGWAPHESQQKPLKPGSAKVSLATALDHSRSGEG